MKSSLRYLAIALPFLAFACGEDPSLIGDGLGESEDAIIGGTPATSADYPSVGALLVKANDPYYGDIATWLCTGTLIAPDVVLLAAHCVDVGSIFSPGATATFYFSFSLDVTDFGYSTTELPANTTEVVKTLKNPSYDPNGFSDGLGTNHDVSLAFLKTPVTSPAPAVVLGPNDATAIVVNASVKIVGYGVRSANYDPNSTNPDDAGIKYLATSVIHEVGSSEMQIGNLPPTPQKCHGDSGGPTFLAFNDNALPAERVIGVTSHAYDSSDCHKGGVDTRVDAYRDWVNTQMIAQCTSHTRTACTGGGGLALPVVPTTPTNPSSKKKSSSCSATGMATPEMGLMVLAVFVASRRRKHG